MLFKHKEIMCFVYVFDYNNENSLNEILDLPIDEKKEVLKFFVGTKYPYFMDEELMEISDKKMVNKVINKDALAKKYFNRILEYNKKKRIFKNEEEARQRVMFVNGKSGLGVKSCFKMIFDCINQNKESMYRVDAYDDMNLKGDNYIVKEIKGGGGGFFSCCCGGRGKSNEPEPGSGTANKVEYVKKSDKDKVIVEVDRFEKSLIEGENKSMSNSKSIDDIKTDHNDQNEYNDEDATEKVILDSQTGISTIVKVEKNTKSKCIVF
jgi:hypothetical protein